MRLSGMGRRALVRRSARVLARRLARSWRGSRRALERGIRVFLHTRSRNFLLCIAARRAFAASVAAVLLRATIAVAEPPIDLVDIKAGAGGFVMNGVEMLAYSGRSVGGGADVNGDGVPDLVVGAPKRTVGNDSYAGRTYVVFGKSGSSAVDLGDIEAGTGGFVIDGGAMDHRAGYSVGLLGDLNGDSKAEIYLHAPQASEAGAYDGTAEAEGKTYIVFGKDTTSSVSLTSIESGTGGFVITGGSLDAGFGKVIANGGDINGDGLDDVLVSSTNYSDGNYVNGRIYVVFGKSTGSAVELDKVGAVSGLGFFINGAASLGGAGESVDGAGDFNGDGLDDIIIGAPYADWYYQYDSGLGFVVFGKQNDETPVNLSDVFAGSGGGVAIAGSVAGHYLGRSVAGVGNVDGDGFDDIVLGVPGLDSDEYGSNNSGGAYVILGRAPTDTISVTDTFTGTGGFPILGQNAYERLGEVASAAGDVNGDGLADILLGAPRGSADNGDGTTRLLSGKSYVVFGRAASIVPSTTDFLEAGVGGIAIRGAVPQDYAGTSVDMAGDVNGDGADDLLVGAYRAAPGTVSGAGEAYVVFSPIPVPINIGVVQSGTTDPVVGGGIFIERTDAPIGFTSSFAGFGETGEAVYRSAPADVENYLVLATAPGFLPSQGDLINPDQTQDAASIIELIADTELANASIVRVAIDLLDENSAPTGHRVLTKNVELRDNGDAIGIAPLWGQGDMVFLGVPSGNFEVFVPDDEDFIYTPEVVNVGTGVDKTVVIKAQLQNDVAGAPPARVGVPGLVTGEVLNTSAPPDTGAADALVIHTILATNVSTFTYAGNDGTYLFPDAIEGAAKLQAFSQDASIEGSTQNVTVVAGQVYGDDEGENTLLSVPLETNDSDFDGLPDDFETTYLGGVPVDEQGPEDDPDNDGLTNFDEYIAELDPTKVDTDGDTVADGVEVLLGSDADNIASVPVPQSLVYVDFGFAEQPQAGTLMNPFNNLTDAANAVAPGGTIRIKGDVDITSGGGPVTALSKNVTLEAFRGTIRAE